MKIDGSGFALAFLDASLGAVDGNQRLYAGARIAVRQLQGSSQLPAEYPAHGKPQAQMAAGGIFGEEQGVPLSERCL